MRHRRKPSKPLKAEEEADLAIEMVYLFRNGHYGDGEPPLRSNSGNSRANDATNPIRECNFAEVSPVFELIVTAERHARELLFNHASRVSQTSAETSSDLDVLGTANVGPDLLLFEY